MKRWIRSTDEKVDAASNESNKLKRTPESGHSYDKPIVFNTADEYLRWCEEDELYED